VIRVVDANGCRIIPARLGGTAMQPHNSSKRRMLNAADAADYCGSSASTFAKLRLNGGGPVYVKLGKRVVYDPADLDRWLAANRRASISERAIEIMA
jgi:predicted DNA-binding transcriptional regulator AlpA